MRPVRRAYNFATFIAECLEILGASTSWSSHRLSKPVQRLLYQPYVPACSLAKRVHSCASYHLHIDNKFPKHHSLFLLYNRLAHVPRDIRTEFVCIHIHTHNIGERQCSKT
jgi:hypothetical protein